MSFRGRLTLFFLLIVVVPMVAVSVLVVQVTDEARSGKADARLFAGLETASSLYRDATAEAEQAAERVARDPELGEAIRSGDAEALRSRLAELALRENASGLVIASPSGEDLARVGAAKPVATARLRLMGPEGEAGTLVASTTSAVELTEQIRRLTGRHAVLLGERGELASTLAASGVELPETGEAADVELEGRELRALTGELTGPGDLRLVLLGPVEASGFLSSSPLVAGALAAFFVVALLFVVLLMRGLQRQVAAMLDAARKIGGGDFSAKVPVVGRDEMAGLAGEFNQMSDRLAAQVAQLRRQQVEIQRSIRRIGEAFASGLDRTALMQIVVETAVAACEADYGLIALRGQEGAEAEAGTPSEKLQDALLAAEASAIRGNEAVERPSGGAHAQSGPLHRLTRRQRAIGAMTIAREGEPFTVVERDVFLYLVEQASASIENVTLYEVVSQQAATDGLTGLANNRAFREQMAREAARAERFGHDLSLMMLDVDNFKQVNDSYGHPQGDEVLRRIARVLDEEPRGVDLPARYGGEEFAVALPDTDIDGAHELAERIRERIAAEPVPMVDREGTLQVTASIGIASIPADAANVETVIAAADAALYVAKREGKNRVARAGGQQDAEHPPAAAGDGSQNTSTL